MDERYCDYSNPEWVEKFNGVRNANYETKIDGNTFYILNRSQRSMPIYKRLFGNIFKQTGCKFERKQMLVMLVMCKVHEQAIIDIMISYGLL